MLTTVLTRTGGWALGCRIDGGQAEYVRVPYADQGLNRIPDTVSDEQALFVGDVLATGFGQPVFQRFPRMILCLLLAPVLPESVLCCV